MSEWWTYRPADFLMFAPDTYWRLFELHNAAWWPLGVLAHALCLALAVALWRRHALAPHLGAGLMAVLSAGVAWGFVWRLYAPINWGAQGLAVMLALGALAWLVLRPAALPSASVGVGRLLLGAALAWPLLSLWDGRPIHQAELIGLAPDPTVVAGLGLLLQLDAPTRQQRIVWWILGLLGCMWCAVSAATLGVMGSPLAWAPLLALAGFLGGALRAGRPHPANRQAGSG